MIYRHGIAVARLQPLHFGHERIITRMLSLCENVTVLIGSAQEYGTDINPFSQLERRAMLRNVFKDKINVTSVNDIGRPDVWPEFILGVVLSRFPKLPAPDSYFCGSALDAAPFVNKGLHMEIDVRDDLSGTKVRAMLNSGFNDWKNWVAVENYTIIENYLNKRKNHG